MIVLSWVWKVYDPPDQGGIPLNAWKVEQKVRCLLEEIKSEIKKGTKVSVLYCLAISASLLSYNVQSSVLNNAFAL